MSQPRRSLLLLVLLLPAFCLHIVAEEPKAPEVQVFFSPAGGCTQAIIAELNAAKQSVRVQAYSFTSAPIAKALLEAHKRGVDVEVILDKSQRTEKYSSADFLHNVGIATRIDDKHAIAHNKLMVIDGTTVITGSFNFTKAAEESNSENLLVIRDGKLAAKYLENWRLHAAHAEVYTGREAQAPAAPIEELPLATTPALNAAAVVASKNSAVFHLSECPSAKKISPKNLIRYGARGEAAAANKKPCTECKP